MADQCMAGASYLAPDVADGLAELAVVCRHWSTAAPQSTMAEPFRLECPSSQTLLRRKLAPQSAPNRPRVSLARQRLGDDVTEGG
jgi:hypothetical protein